MKIVGYGQSLGIKGNSKTNLLRGMVRPNWTRIG